MRVRWRPGATPPLFSNRSISITVIYLVSLISISCPFNLDDSAPVYKFGPPRTHFGYSVAQHFRGDQPIVLVGAPKGENDQKSTIQAGAVYSCPLNTHYTDDGGEWCTKLHVEYPEEKSYSNRPDMEVSVGTSSVHFLGKNYQQLGAAVASTGQKGGGAIVCAPLTRYHNVSARLQGSCYMLNEALEHTNTLITCESKNLQTQERHNTYGACMQGLSAYMDKDIIITGVIGARMWTGGVYARTNLQNRFDSVIEKFTMSSGGGSEQQEFSVRPNLQSHDYLGFSVEVGRFGFWHENGQRLTVVSGATRYNHSGAVVFLPFNKEAKTDNHLGLTDDKFVLTRENGRRMGSAFGYAIAVVDLNGDKYDDLIVGAPFEHRNDKDGQFGGVVYVYFSRGHQQHKLESSKVFHHPIVLKHAGYFSQFGMAVAKIGNVDGDRAGTNDFAVGAPFAYEGAGAVYIYHGSTDMEKFRRKPAQIIKGSTLPTLSRPIRSFGFSLSGGVDLDGNGYPDLVVGAYNSSMVTILRARPVVSIQAGHKTAKRYIDIDGKGRCPSGVATCFDLDLTLRVEGTLAKQNLIDYRNDVFVCNLEVLPFATGIPPRAHISSSVSPQNFTWPCGKNVNVEGKTYRQKILIPDTSSMQDWVNPLKFRFTVRIKDEQKPKQPQQGRSLVDLNQYPILNKFGSTYDFTIPFNTRCGEDHVCETDLVLRAAFADIPKTNDGYVSKVGDKDHLDVQFTVENRGEKAYNALLNLTYDPEELELPQLKPKDTRGLTLETIGKNSVVVQLGNPMDGNMKHTFDISFKIVRGRTEGIGRPLQFKAVLNSTSDELNPQDNSWEAKVRLIKEAELELIGMSDPPIVRYGGQVKGANALQMEEDIGPMLRHNYTLHNKGPWTVRNVKAIFEWPYEVASRFRKGKFALYLLDIPTVVMYNVHSGTTDVRRCSVERAVEHINPEQIALNTKYSVEVTQPMSREHLIIRRSVEMEPVDDSQRPQSAGLFSDRIAPTKRREGDVDVDVVTISCTEGSAKCFTVVCHFDFIDANSAPVIDFRARLWNSTFIEDYSDVEYVDIQSWGRIEIDESQGIADDPANNIAYVSTQAYPDRPALDESRPIPWWVILVAVAIGLLILAIIVGICWKCGFFKRKRVAQPSLYQAELRHEREQWSEM